MSTSHPKREPLGTPLRGLSPNTGVLATAAWLAARDVYPQSAKWFAEITLEAKARDSRFVIEVYSDEWGFKFVHDGRTSWIRVTDVAFKHGADEHELLRQVPRLTNVGVLIAALEQKHGIQFDRSAPAIRTDVAGAESAIAEWARSL